MSYADSTYYLTTYLGTDPGNSTELNRALARASDDVDLATQFGIVEADLSSQNLTLVKKANCAQAEFYVMNGDTYNEPEKAESISILSFSQNKALTQPKPVGGLCARAMQFLEQTGLMERRAALVGSYGNLVGDDE